MNRKLEATPLRGNLWAVRPEGRLGTCGWIDGYGWTVQYVRARDASDAVANASPEIIFGRKRHATLQA